MFSLGGDDDIFGHMDRMMNQMMGGMMPGGGGGGVGLPHGFPNPNQQLMAHQSMMGRHQDALSSLMMSPFGGFGGLGGLGGGPGGPGGLMNLHNSMMFGGGGGLNNMMQLMQQSSAASNAPGTFVQQQFVSYRSDGVNPPQVVERTHLNRVGPGGVREERRTLRDSRSGVQQMHIGRHINDRGHVMERSRNRQTGEEEESQEFINIEEEEAEQFQSEWSSRMGAAAANGRNHGAHRALQSGSHRPPLAITSGGEGGGGGGLSGASRSAAASPRHHHHHHQQHHHQQHHSRLSPPSPASTSSLDNAGGSRGKKSLRVKPVAMKKEKKSKKPSSSLPHLPKE